jgi:hypothetical protein
MKWSMRRRAGNQSVLFGAMMGKLGIDAAQVASLGGRQLETASRRCLFCSQSRACGFWIGSRTEQEAEAPPFCPNAGIFAAARARDASPAL